VYKTTNVNAHLATATTTTSFFFFFLSSPSLLLLFLLFLRRSNDAIAAISVVKSSTMVSRKSVGRLKRIRSRVVVAVVVDHRRCDRRFISIMIMETTMDFEIWRGSGMRSEREKTTRYYHGTCPRFDSRGSFAKHDVLFQTSVLRPVSPEKPRERDKKRCPPPPRRSAPKTKKRKDPRPQQTAAAIALRVCVARLSGGRRGASDRPTRAGSEAEQLYLLEATVTSSPVLS